MSQEYWQRQPADKPLFPDLLWSRPETKMSAGKLLIIGGNGHGFAAPAEAYSASLQAGIGAARVMMPLAVKKLAGKLFETVEYAPSNLSGSFAKNALAELVSTAHWADGVLIAGDLGRNSETAIVLEKFLGMFKGQVTLVKDAVDYAIEYQAANMPHTLMVLTIAQLQKLFIKCAQPTAITFDMGLMKLVEALHDFTSNNDLSLIVKQLDQMIVATGGKVATMKTEDTLEESWRVKTAAKAAVWWLQNPNKTFESLITSLL